MKIIISSTPVVLWHSIVQEAESQCSTHLHVELESYLVFLLMKYLTKPELAKRIMASEYLQSLAAHPNKRRVALQTVGDECLLFSGLFPKQAHKRLVKISYFISLGKVAYTSISHSKSDLFGSLALHFVPIMDILQTITQADLLPLEAYDLWNDTQSPRALAMLKEYTKSSATPMQSKEESDFIIFPKK
jgi:hypothetical protein